MSAPAPQAAPGPSHAARAAPDQGEFAGDRQLLVQIGIGAVFVACVVFAAARAIVQWHSGALTGYWINLIGALVMGCTWVWFRRAPLQRDGVAVHLTAGTAAVALTLPLVYGMASSVWWLTLIAFAVALMGTRREAAVWGTIVLITMVGSVAIEQWGRVPGAAGEGLPEALLARVVFAGLLFGIGLRFRAVAEARAAALRETAERLEAANRVKSAFLANMSHELRTPLHGILGLGDLALAGPLPAPLREDLQTMHASARLLLRTLDDVLELSRSAAGQLELADEPFALDRVVYDALRPLANEAARRGLTFHASADPRIVAGRRGDPVRVAQILTNLVGNAIKFTPEGQVSVRLDADGSDPELLVLTVSDTGIGIPAEQQARIFAPFTQVDEGFSRRYQGTGLGLAIAADLAARMGGGIEVRSELGAGSTFIARLRLPHDRDAPRAAAGFGARLPELGLAELPLPANDRTPAEDPARELPPAGARLRVLVAEDNEVNQVLVIKALERLGHTHRLAADGGEAWALLQHEEFDALLTDVQMPGMDGPELTAKVRAREHDEGRERLPIVALTAHALPEDEARLLAAGMDAYLAKPFVTRQIADVLARVVVLPASREPGRPPPAGG
jgi:signal transduction histidine kinase/ActR/RegA family two-component response regulator